MSYPLSLLSIPITSTFGGLRARGSGLRALLFILECVLGVVAVVLVSALAHWAGWLLPVAALLYLLIVVPIALLCGFWQAVIVSLSAVFLHGIFSTHQPQANLAADPANSVALLAFVIVALVVSRLSSRVKDHAQEAESWGGQMHDLYEFTRRTLEMNLHVEPGPQLAELVHEIFALEAVAVFDADLHEVYQAGNLERGPAGAGAERLLLRDLGRRSGDRPGAPRRPAGDGAGGQPGGARRNQPADQQRHRLADRHHLRPLPGLRQREPHRDRTPHRAVALDGSGQPGPRLQDAADGHSRGLAPAWARWATSRRRRRNWWR